MGYFLFNTSFSNKDISLGPITISSDSIDFLIKKCLTVIIVIFLMFITIKIGNRLINKFVKKQIENPNSKLTMSPQKAKTIGAVMHSILKYSVYFIGIAIIISDLFKGISLTFASIGGFAVGFGAQSLVQDLINGFFILFEDQYGVGDYVTIGTFEGIIDSIGIRTTILKDFNGDLHLIPNGTIKAVTNHSRNNMRFIVDVSIAYEEDIDHAIDIIDKTCKEFQGEHKEDVPQPIDIWGVTNLGASGVNIRIVGFSIPMKQWSMERNLRKAIKEALDKEGIEIPYNKTQIIMKEA
ncbi:mechanosensitive ion channel family protein [Clostridium sardiniense]|uniref:Mechanosensitive ion channel family protein n=1 Tax=Clostridium sardiniense TaxID=29369 RepID=A0ABS7L1Y9_CLOSR|nr:mechanosensitive ion channel family protein [Clostridium sardiniense]MBY0757075.1 mechanosensitive ion channel family protein [Clostridium sardiniense]MDQ0461767.1 small conductance mechanosensitive channel [Clostridium sardiniense]